MAKPGGRSALWYAVTPAERVFVKDVAARLGMSTSGLMRRAVHLFLMDNEIKVPSRDFFRLRYRSLQRLRKYFDGEWHVVDPFIVGHKNARSLRSALYTAAKKDGMTAETEIVGEMLKVRTRRGDTCSILAEKQS